MPYQHHLTCYFIIIVPVATIVLISTFNFFMLRWLVLCAFLHANLETGRVYSKLIEVTIKSCIHKTCIMYSSNMYNVFHTNADDCISILCSRHQNSISTSVFL